MRQHMKKKRVRKWSSIVAAVLLAITFKDSFSYIIIDFDLADPDIFLYTPLSFLLFFISICSKKKTFGIIGSVIDYLFCKLVLILYFAVGGDELDYWLILLRAFLMSVMYFFLFTLPNKAVVFGVLSTIFNILTFLFIFFWEGGSFFILAYTIIPFLWPVFAGIAFQRPRKPKAKPKACGSFLPSSFASVSKQLVSLKSLLDDGTLTEEEFAEKKTKLIAGYLGTGK